MTIEVSVESTRTEPDDRSSFAWQVLSTLAADTEINHDDGRLTVRLTMASSISEADH